MHSVSVFLDVAVYAAVIIASGMTRTTCVWLGWVLYAERYQSRWGLPRLGHAHCSYAYTTVYALDTQRHNWNASWPDDCLLGLGVLACTACVACMDFHDNCAQRHMTFTCSRADRCQSTLCTRTHASAGACTAYTRSSRVTRAAERVLSQLVEMHARCGVRLHAMHPCLMLALMLRIQCPV